MSSKKKQLGGYRARTRLPAPRLHQLYINAKSSHSPDEKANAFNVLASYVILDEQAEEGWRKAQRSYRMLVKNMRRQTGVDYPEPAGKLADWYERCIEVAESVNDRLASLDAMLDCAWLAYVVRTLVTKPPATALV